MQDLPIFTGLGHFSTALQYGLNTKGMWGPANANNDASDAQTFTIIQ